MSVKFLAEDQTEEADFDYLEQLIKEVEIPGSMNLSLCYLKTKQWRFAI